MDIDAKPLEENIVLVHDKILMALLGANGIKPVHILMTGWPSEPAEFERESYLAYRQTLKVVDLIEQFKQRKATINLDDYLNSASELEGYLGGIIYMPKGLSHSDMAPMPRQIKVEADETR